MGKTPVKVLVSCAVNKRSIGGNISGLSGGTLSLKVNEITKLTGKINGSFKFTEKINQGAHYTVTVGSKPADHTCTVSNGEGNVGGSEIQNVYVKCSSSRRHTNAQKIY